jgi:hypothetical protein
MAGALVSASYKINAQTPATLPVINGAVSTSIDMVTTHSSVFPHCSHDRKAILLSRLHISTSDEENGTKTKTIYLARDIHKMLHCNNAGQGAQMAPLDADTTLAQFFGGSPKPISFGFWMPMRHDGSSAFVATDLTVAQLNDLIRIGTDLKIGLRIQYTDTTLKTLYVDVSDADADTSWSIGVSSNRVPHHNQAGLVPSTLTTANAKYVSADLISLQYMATKALSLFGLSISDIDPGSDIEIAPFAYVGPTISGFSGSAPTTYGLLSSVASFGGTYWSYTQERVAAESQVTIAMSVDNTYNTETFDSDDYGWLANLDAGVNDTSINVEIGTP